MKLSKLFKLGKTQAELDFIDIDPDKDIGLYVDSHLIGASHHPFAEKCHSTISSFFNYFLALIKDGGQDDARELFSHLHEPNETCLGSSVGTPNGRGVGGENASDIFESVMSSRAIETGVLEHLEDFRIFVHGVGPDKVSDMTTNIIRHNLIEYTQTQCDLHGIQMRDMVATGPWWDSQNRQWQWSHERMLIVDERPILLVPKCIVSYGRAYSADIYHRQFVLNFVKRAQLASNGPFVRHRKPKRGQKVGDAYVLKKELAVEYPPQKDFIAGFTQQHKGVFEGFREFTTKHAKPLDHSEISASNIPEICLYLANKLTVTPSGNEAATAYHHLITGILELIFYPSLACPQKEREIHDGRKRIDIVFDNAARDGEFYRLMDTRKIPAHYIVVECKNYGKDVANPEVDQLVGRFSFQRGEFGMLVCRSVENYQTLIKRCQDVFTDRRGLIIPILDSDLIVLLEKKASDPTSRPEEDFIRDRIREVAYA
ncbi:hypothetical protein O3299_08070 [Janthinobacterium sp. SUN176]|uniref:hypothetical protein n=1 Tax=Janthinobacterium sp. SUN176 TaxID=3014788 RepID=UPI00271255B0|nr:hypothetical protein [Janthinobacterium sp. SUN176]MDO8071481.1 hypothetical protein [Janthinobacterium sp. SUN176]